MMNRQLLKAIGDPGPIPDGVILVIIRAARRRPQRELYVSLQLTGGQKPQAGTDFVVRVDGKDLQLVAFQWADSSTLIALRADATVP
jgi:hypothetical protein